MLDQVYQSHCRLNSICGIQNSYTNQTLSNTEIGIQLSPRYLPEIALGILKEMGEIDSAFMGIDFVSSPHPLDRSSQDQEKINVSVMEKIIFFVHTILKNYVLSACYLINNHF